MTIVLTRDYRLGEFHRFAGADRDFMYMVPSGAIFELDGPAADVVAWLGEGALAREDLAGRLAAAGLPQGDAVELLGELVHAGVIATGEAVARQPAAPPKDYPLHALVMNITNQCNLACTYCYEFGADKIATPAGKPKYMDIDTARASVDFLLAQSAERKSVHITFFGGETLMNFRLLRDVVVYARERVAAEGRKVDFSLTTNATLLTDEIIEFLADNAIGVTVSMDGPAELQDKRRVYKSGKGSYAVIEPKLRKLLARDHRARHPDGRRDRRAAHLSSPEGRYRLPRGGLRPRHHLRRGARLFAGRWRDGQRDRPVQAARRRMA